MQKFNFSQDTPFGDAEIEIRRVADSYEATVILPSGSELEIEIAGSSFEGALKRVEQSVDYWASESSAEDDSIDLSDPNDTPWA